MAGGRSPMVVALALLLTTTACGDRVERVAHRTSETTEVPGTTSSTAAATTVETSTTTSTTRPSTTTTVAPVSTTTTAPTGPPPPYGANWRGIPAAPGTADGAPVWTGQELVVWSGTEERGSSGGQGYAYRPGDHGWRTLAAAPIGKRTSHTGVWTGREILYWGGLYEWHKVLGDGAAYDPARDTWRPLSPSPLGPRYGHEAVWTGREMIVWGGMDQCCAIDSTIHDTEAMAYDPAADTWRQLPDVPAPWSGDGGPALTEFVGGRMLVYRHGHLGAYEIAAERWHDLGEAPPPPPSGDETGCWMSGGPMTEGDFSDERLAVWTGGCETEDGVAYDLVHGRWSTLGRAPEGGLTRVLAGPTLFGVGGSDPRLLRYDESGHTWRPVDVPADRFGKRAFMAWTGDELLVWGGYREGSDARTGILVRPTE